jgi:hypothetical protein
MQNTFYIRFNQSTKFVDGFFPKYENGSLINYTNNAEFQQMLVNKNYIEGTEENRNWCFAQARNPKVINGALQPDTQTQAEIDADKLAEAKINAVATLQLNYNNTQKAIIQTNEGQFNISLRGEEWKTDIHKQWTDANILGSALMLNKITGVAVNLTKDYWNNFYQTYNTISIGNLEKQLKTQKEIQNATSLTALNNINLKPYPAVPVFDIAGSVSGGSYTVTPPTTTTGSESLFGGDIAPSNGAE